MYADNKPNCQQQLNALIGEGHEIVSDLKMDPAATKFKQKLHSLEDQWQSISKQSDERKKLLDKLASSWQSYQELMKKLSKGLDTIQQFIDQHPVLECAVDDIKPLLDQYKVLDLLHCRKVTYLFQCY